MSSSGLEGLPLPFYTHYPRPVSSWTSVFSSVKCGLQCLPPNPGLHGFPVHLGFLIFCFMSDSHFLPRNIRTEIHTRIPQVLTCFHFYMPTRMWVNEWREINDPSGSERPLPAWTPKTVSILGFSLFLLRLSITIGWGKSVYSTGLETCWDKLSCRTRQQGLGHSDAQPTLDEGRDTEQILQCTRLFGSTVSSLYADCL